MYVVWLFGISASVYHWSVLLFIVWCLRTFNNISVISWRSVISVEETKRPGKNHRPVASHWQTLSHNVAHLPWSRFELTTSAVIDNDCKGNNYNQYWCLWLELCHYRPLRYVVVFLTYDMLNVMSDVKYYTYNILTYKYYWNIIYKKVTSLHLW